MGPAAGSSVLLGLNNIVLCLSLWLLSAYDEVDGWCCRSDHGRIGEVGELKIKVQETLFGVDTQSRGQRSREETGAGVRLSGQCPGRGLGCGGGGVGTAGEVMLTTQRTRVWRLTGASRGQAWVCGRPVWDTAGVKGSGHIWGAREEAVGTRGSQLLEKSGGLEADRDVCRDRN